MKLSEYIFGSRRGREANAIEKEALTDPFLADAIEGYDAVYGNHADRLAALGQQVAGRAGRGRKLHARRRMLAWVSGVAAVALAGTVLGVLYLPGGGAGSGADDMVAVLTDSSVPDVMPSMMSAEVAEEGAFAAVAEDAGPGVQAGQEAENAAQGGVAEAGNALAADMEAPGDIVHGRSAAPASAALAAVPVAASAVVGAEAEAPHAEPAGEDAVPGFDAAATAAVPVRAVNADDALLDGAVSEPEGVAFVSNPEFEEYFLQNRRRTVDDAGNRIEGVVVAEFRVNRAGVPSSIRITQGISQEVNREVIELLLSGPRWEPTGDDRIRIELHYR